ncbi:MAG TPA: ATP-binding protein [Candidatus Dormibacteraeota bacterium]|nr:ATP-binding protein [Candidatus Dormibacteraeota bacterium]
MPALALLAPLRRRLVVLALLIVLPVCGLLVYDSVQQRRGDMARARDAAMAISQLAAADQENFTKNTRQLLATLTQFPFMLLTTNRPFVETNFGNLRKLSPDYLNFGLIETNGDVFGSAEPTPVKVNLADRTYFQEVLRTHRFAAGDFQTGRVTHQPSLNFGYPVLDENGHLQRVLYASLKLSLLSEALAGIPLPAGATVTVIDRKGNVLARYPEAEKWIGRALATNGVVAKTLEGKEPVFEMAGVDGVERLHAVTSIQAGNIPAMYVTVGMPMSDIRSEANSALIVNLVVLLAVAALALFIARAYSRRYFLEPVSALSSAAKRLADGDVEARAGAIGGVQELAELGRVFDEMATRLQRRQEEVLQAQQEVRTLNEDLEKRVQERTSQLEAANKELEAFSYSVSHDLRAPLRHISGFVELFRRREPRLQDEDLHFLNMIDGAAKQMGRLVDDLLSFSRMSRAEMRLRKVDLARLVDEAVGALKNELNGRSIEWQVQTLPEVTGDAALLRVVMDNLLGNAVKYTRPRDRARIEIGAEGTEREQIIFVRDNGVGFSMEFADKLFGVFQRLHHATAFEGTGIGLATVQRIILRQGGRVWAQAEENAGATFYFALPR